MKVRYLGTIDTFALVENKIYEVISVEKGWYRIMTELDEDYLFPAKLFEVFDEEEQVFSVGLCIYARIDDLGGILTKEKHEFSSVEAAKKYVDEFLGLRNKCLISRCHLLERVVDNCDNKLVSKLSLYLRLYIEDGNMNEQYIERYERSFVINKNMEYKFKSEWKEVKKDWNSSLF